MQPSAGEERQWKRTCCIPQRNALLIILDPVRMLYLFGGVCMGLSLGILPGIGGIAGTALLLPFTYNLDPPTAFALLLGLGATTTTADPIAAILFGAPGHAASAATTLDGYPMTRRGEAGRALGASYMAALIGGLFGAALMAVALPVLRPIILYIGSPELLGVAVFGISMVAVLSGNAPLRGLTAACFGMMLAMIGTDPQSGTLRWTMDTLYLWDGLPLVPLTLGIFALPELCDLAIGRMAVVQEGQTIDTKTGMLLGVKDCMRALVPDPALLVDRLGDGSDTRHRRFGDRLDFLRPRAAHRERRGARLSAPATCAASLPPKARPTRAKAARWCRPSPSACRRAPAWRSCSAPSSFTAWCPGRKC